MAHQSNTTPTRSSLSEGMDELFALRAESPDKIASIISGLADLIPHDFAGAQTWADILAWPVGECRNLNGTANTKVYQSANMARFVTEIPPGAELLKHFHDCTETCRVIVNSMADRISGRRWGIDETAVFAPGKKHTPYNPSNTHTTWVEVTFYK